MTSRVHRLVTIIASITAKSPYDQYSYLKDLILAKPEIINSVDVDSTSFAAEIEHSGRNTAADVSS